jgi:uncharacterized RDD family membrane protein YckC
MLDGVIVASTVLLVALVVSSVDIGAPGDWLYFILFVPAALYHLLCELLMNGQSVGKRLVKIKVVRIDGSEASFGNYLLRWLLRFIEITVCYGSIALVAVIINGRGQRIGDIAAGTCVIKVKQRTRLSDTIYADVALSEAPVYPQVAHLRDDEVAVARDVIAATRESRRSTELNRIAETAASKLARRMGVEFEGPALRFLQTVVQDYNRINGANS